MSKDKLRREIHVGCKELGLDEATRHDLQLMATGKASMRDMNEEEMRKVVQALGARGFRAGRKGRKRAPRADIRYAHVLWGLLYKAGQARVAGAEGLNAFIRSRFGNVWGHVPIDIDAMTEAAEIRDVIEALKEWCHRADIPTEIGGRGR